jgi:hypothetical protein
VSQDDWDIATEIWKTSCGIRDWVLAERRRFEDEAEADKTRRAAPRSAVVSHAVKNGDARINALARRIAFKVHETGRMTNRDITRKALRNDERGLFPAIMECGEALGWVVSDGDRAWLPGQSKPA